MRTIVFNQPVNIVSSASFVSKKEADGPLGEYFDMVLESEKKYKSFEKAEAALLQGAVRLAVKRSGREIGVLLAGDLLNQITSSGFIARDFGFPFLGLYSACANMGEALVLGSVLIDGGFIETVATATVSHFATAERQYRGPLEFGAQRPPYSQWTVSGAGSIVLSKEATKKKPKITAAIIGKVVDFKIKDASNMGAAMAPAALDTLKAILDDLRLKADNFDMILTGDLGKLGSDILRKIASDSGINLGKNYHDCGCMLFDSSQKVYQGGSGCGCSAAVLTSFILQRMAQGRLKKVLFLATGCLLSPLTSFQGESMPSICHAVVIEM